MITIRTEVRRRLRASGLLPALVDEAVRGAQAHPWLNGWRDDWGLPASAVCDSIIREMVACGLESLRVSGGQSWSEGDQD